MKEDTVAMIREAVRQLRNNNTTERADYLVNEMGIHPDIVNAVADGLQDDA